MTDCIVDEAKGCDLMMALVPFDRGISPLALRCQLAQAGIEWKEAAVLIRSALNRGLVDLDSHLQITHGKRSREAP